MSITVKQVSSLEKIMCSGIDSPNTISQKTIMKGECFSYQIAIKAENDTELTTEIVSPLKEYISVYSVKNAIMDFPVYTDDDYPFPPPGDDFITKKPCLMPDILMPIELEKNLVRLTDETVALWIAVRVPADIQTGEYSIVLKLRYSKNNEESRNTSFENEQKLILNVIDAKIPEQKTIFTQWFHTDCIADIHNVPIYSEEHWELIDKYMAMASELGINMILTPIITPPLDTEVGTARPCTQLVKIEKKKETYIFDFTLFKRWIELVDKNNIKYFEMCHLFSQWGLKYAPNIKVTENGKEEYMFGWHTEATSPEYKEFLNQFLPALINFCKEEGIKERCWFHISDEPRINHIEAYQYAHGIVKPLIEDCRTLDALSEYEFYKKGLVDTPVTSTQLIEPFLEANIENQWAYYCCAEYVDVGNRFMSMPSYRNRILGLQIYKYNIKGFLHWGYNFYNNQLSRRKINPYVTTSCDKAFPSGDPFSVYPIENGVVPSLRALVFKEALNDIEVCRVLESYIGRDKVIEMIDNAAGMSITFFDYPRNNEFIPLLIENMEKIIEKYI